MKPRMVHYLRLTPVSRTLLMDHPVYIYIFVYILQWRKMFIESDELIKQL